MCIDSGMRVKNRGCRAASAICHKYPCDDWSRVCSRKPNCVCEEDILKFTTIDPQQPSSRRTTLPG